MPARAPSFLRPPRRDAPGGFRGAKHAALDDPHDRFVLFRAREKRAAAGSSVGEFPVGDSRSAEIRFRDGHELGALPRREEVIEHQQQRRLAEKLHGRLGRAQRRRGEITERRRAGRGPRGGRGTKPVFPRLTVPAGGFQPRTRIATRPAATRPDGTRDAVRRLLLVFDVSDAVEHHLHEKVIAVAAATVSTRVGPPRIGQRETHVFVRQVLLRAPLRPRLGPGLRLRLGGRPRTRLRVVETPRERVRHRNLHPSARASEPPSDVARLVAARARRERFLGGGGGGLDVGAPRGAAAEPESVADGGVPQTGDRSDVRGSIRGGGDGVGVVGVVVGCVGFGSFAIGAGTNLDVSVGVDAASARGSFVSFDVAANDGETETDVDRPGFGRARASSGARGDVEVSVSGRGATLEVERTRIRGEVLHLPEESPVERVELGTRRRPRRAGSRALARAGSDGENRGR